MYLRPLALGTSPFLGVQPADHVKLFTIMSPVGPYYKSGFKPIKLFADTVNVRAWPGGMCSTYISYTASLQDQAQSSLTFSLT